MIEREGGDDARALEILMYADERGSHNANWQLGYIHDRGTRLGITKDVIAAQA